MIYTSTSAPKVSLNYKVKVAAYSVSNCNELGFTGRVLAVPDMAINILEGPERLLSDYVEAIRTDDLIELLIMHHSEALLARKFDDYSVWLTYKPNEHIQGVHRLTSENFESALPSDLPLKARLFIDANFDVNSVGA